MKKHRRPLNHYLSLAYPFQVITGSDPGYFVMFPDLPGCMTQADTPEEIGALAEDARRLWIETEYERGNDIPLPSGVDDYSGKFVLRLPRSLHQQLVWSSEREGASLNQYVVMLLAQRDAQASIESKIDALAARVAAMDARLRYQIAGLPPARAEKPRPRANVRLVAA